MAIDPSRALFVSKDYRYAVINDADVLGNFPNARAVVLETNLDESDAAALAAQIKAQNEQLPMAFQIEIDGALDIEAFDGGLPHYTLEFQQYETDSRLFKLVACEIDYMTDTTMLTVRAI